MIQDTAQQVFLLAAFLHFLTLSDDRFHSVPFRSTKLVSPTLPPECSDWEILLEEKGFLFTFPRALSCLTSLPGEDFSTDPQLSNPVGLFQSVPFPLLSLELTTSRLPVPLHSPALPRIHLPKSSPSSYPLTIKEQYKLSSGGARPVCRGKKNMLVFMKKCKYVHVCGSCPPHHSPPYLLRQQSDTELELASQTAPEIHLSLAPNTEVPRGACHAWMLHSRWWEFRLCTLWWKLHWLNHPRVPRLVFTNVTLKYSVCTHGLYFPRENSPTLHTQPITLFRSPSHTTY